MAELSVEDKCKLASQLVEQAPPGEVNDVINDIRAVIGSDEALMPFIRPALRSYMLAQLTVVEHPASDDVPVHTSLLSEATILPGTSGEDERYIDADGKRSFVFDHINMTISDYQPYELPEEEAAFRADLAKSLAAYCKNHFPSGSSSVSSSQFPLLPPSPPPPVPALATTPETIDAAPKADAEAEATAADPGAADESELAEPGPTAAEPVTDVVPEQLNTGDAEPASTPAVGDVEAKTEQVEQPGGLEKLVEEVEKVKVEEEGEEAPEESGLEKPEVTEESGAVESTEVEAKEEQVETVDSTAEPEPSEPAADPIEATAPAVEELKQEHIDNPVYTLEIVGNRYNTANFWTGRWRTRWVVDQAAGTVSGTINVDVHYYEQGNVQLATNHTSSFPCPTAAFGSQSIASQIVTTISKIETAYHLELNEVYGELGDKVFRGLRRALPVTRQKMEWDKVSGYSLGSDLSKARA